MATMRRPPTDPGGEARTHTRLESGDTPLHEYDYDEWWDVYRHVFPSGTRETFDSQWRDFIAYLRPLC